MEADGDYQSITLHARSTNPRRSAGWMEGRCLSRQAIEGESKKSKWMVEEVGVGDDNIIVTSSVPSRDLPWNFHPSREVPGRVMEMVEWNGNGRSFNMVILKVNTFPP